jgi:hypothetical protein
VTKGEGLGAGNWRTGAMVVGKGLCVCGKGGARWS